MVTPGMPLNSSKVRNGFFAREHSSVLNDNGKKHIQCLITVRMLRQSSLFSKSNGVGIDWRIGIRKMLLQTEVTSESTETCHRLRRSTWGGFGVNFKPKDKSRGLEYERE